MGVSGCPAALGHGVRGHVAAQGTASAWILLPDGAADRFHGAYRSTPDDATLRRARGWAVLHALSRILIADAGVRGRPGGKPTWSPPAHASLRRLLATAGH